ncbi:sterol desaturase family protein [Adhaeretor mobilis]|uniref:Fatty acid hydroxylase superfamily protein n=1 Tax=Adhaeretor mobilis TaxID=1930276 RepID=A0A517N0S4_9BACT|nr:sterol desaturase family protein [Adhaeretor mobilis]QDT00714.1 Fatty acid hydroxylase superfamily protein [Adhaeretor mobilis]
MGPLKSEMDSDHRQFGSGWISGMLSSVLALIGLATVLCLLYPQLLTVADVRGYYNVALVRVALHAVLIAAFLMGGLSATLRQSKLLGFAGMTTVLVATLLGGSRASSQMQGESDVYFGLDFFMLNLILLGTLFIPIERLFKKRNQPIFRAEWREDLFYFFISSLLVQSLTYLSLTPSMTILARTEWAGGIRAGIASQPVLVQFLEIMFLTDLVQYWFHRAFHEFPWLWRFHAVHHSAKHMDWIAGSRMHLVEIILLRAFTTIPMYALGFGEPALYGYIFFVYLLSVFVHSNLRFHFGPLQHVLATPRFHHWHHGIEKEAININYAVHFPLLDRLFGTYHMPKDQWPEGYGIAGHPVPLGYWQQFWYPFSRKVENQSDDETKGES